MLCCIAPPQQRRRQERIWRQQKHQHCRGIQSGSSSSLSRWLSLSLSLCARSPKSRLTELLTASATECSSRASLSQSAHFSPARSLSRSRRRQLAAKRRLPSPPHSHKPASHLRLPSPSPPREQLAPELSNAHSSPAMGSASSQPASERERRPPQRRPAGRQ